MTNKKKLILAFHALIGIGTFGCIFYCLGYNRGYNHGFDTGKKFIDDDLVFDEDEL